MSFLGLDYACNDFGGTTRGICVESCMDKMCLNAKHLCEKTPGCNEISVNSLKTMATLKGKYKWKNSSIEKSCNIRWHRDCSEYANYPFFDNSLNAKGLILDVGLHEGHDSSMYLRHNYKVIAVEARMYPITHPVLLEGLSNNLFYVHHSAIANESGKHLTFYTPRGHTELASLHKSTCRHTQCHTHAVKTITCADMLNAQDMHVFLLKVDIEGADLACIETLRQVIPSKLPKYVAVEDNKAIHTLVNIGYSKFKLVAGIEMSSCMITNTGSAGNVAKNEVGGLPEVCINAITRTTKWSSFKRTVSYRHYDHIHRFKPHDLYAKLS